jgi:hypothetical protein
MDIRCLETKMHGLDKKIIGIQNPLDPSRPLPSPPGASPIVPSQTRNNNDISSLLGPRRRYF